MTSTEKWFQWSGDRRAMRDLRSDVREQLEEWAIPSEDADRLVLIVDELASNSIDHADAYREVGNHPGIRLSLDDGRVDLAFIDPDVPPDLAFELEVKYAEMTGPPQLDDERGRGLFLVRQTLEDVRFQWADGVGLTLSGRLRRRGES